MRSQSRETISNVIFIQWWDRVRICFKIVNGRWIHILLCYRGSEVVKPDKTALRWSYYNSNGPSHLKALKIRIKHINSHTAFSKKQVLNEAWLLYSSERSIVSRRADLGPPMLCLIHLCTTTWLKTKYPWMCRPNWKRSRAISLAGPSEDNTCSSIFIKYFKILYKQLLMVMPVFSWMLLNSGSLPRTQLSHPSLAWAGR